MLSGWFGKSNSIAALILCCHSVALCAFRGDISTGAVYHIQTLCFYWYLQTYRLLIDLLLLLLRLFLRYFGTACKNIYYIPLCIHVQMLYFSLFSFFIYFDCFFARTFDGEVSFALGLVFLNFLKDRIKTFFEKHD